MPFSPPTQLPLNGHGYTASLYHECGKASYFITLVNNGGLQIPSTSVFKTIQYCEHIIFRSNVIRENSQYINNETNLKKKMIIEACQHFSLDSSEELFSNHGEGLNEMLLEDDHRTKLIKYVRQINTFRMGRNTRIHFLRMGRNTRKLL